MNELATEMCRAVCGRSALMRITVLLLVHPFGYAYGLLPTDNRVTQSRHDAPCGAAASR